VLKLALLVASILPLADTNGLFPSDTTLLTFTEIGVVLSAAIFLSSPPQLIMNNDKVKIAMVYMFFMFIILFS